MIRPYIRDLIDEHKPITESNTNNDNSNNNNNNYNNNNNSNSNNRAEWKIQLIITNNFIPVKDFEDTRAIYLASKPVEIFMGSNTMSLIRFLIQL